MKKLIIFILLAFCAIPLVVLWQKEAAAALINPTETTSVPESADGPRQPKPELLSQKAVEALKFCREHNLNTEAAILIDLGIHSGYNRCWVVRLADGAIRMKGLVTHGSGKTGLAAGERKYSNAAGSLLSSLGKYKTGVSYNGQYGLAFKLYGLEATNSNAYSRFIVLHGHECVPNYETEELLCQSWGCPTVSPEFLLQLQKVIKAGKSPMLVWVYDSLKGE